MNSRDITKAQIETQKIDEVFYFYDEPKLYSCRLDNGERYIVFWADEDHEKQIWFYVRISDCRYLSLLENEIPLRALFERTEDGYFYLVSLTKYDHYEVKRVSPAKISSELFPQQNVYLNQPKPRMRF